MKNLLILLFAYFGIFSELLAQSDKQIDFSGFVDTYHAVRTKKTNDFMTSRTRFRGELSKRIEKSTFFVSFNLLQNSLQKDLNGFELREAYFDYNAKSWSLRAGRQLIIWGAADGVRITDKVSPMDMTEFLARDYDDIRMPVEALRLRYFKGEMKLEMVYVPVFKEFVLPFDSNNPWAIPLSSNMKLLPDSKPKRTLKNGEIGGRLTFNLSGVDFSFATLYTFNKMPAFYKFKRNDSICMRPEYKRMTFVGGDISKPIGQFVLRAEAAFNINKVLEVKQLSKNLEKHNTLHYLVGLDWYAPSEWMLTMQFSDETIFNYSNSLVASKHNSLMTLNISKKLFNSSLKVANFLYADLENSSFFNRLSLDYSLSDPIHFFLGYDHFKGDKGMFGIYKNNSEIWAKLKYSF